MITTSITGGGISKDSEAGTVTVSLDPTDTEDLPSRGLTHELEIEDTAGNLSTAAVGHITLLKTINRGE